MIISAALAAALGSSFAAPSTREQLLRAYAEVLGIKEMIDASERSFRETIGSQREKRLAELKESGLSDAAAEKTRAAFDHAMEKIFFSWSREEAAHIYISALADGMSDRDLEDAIAFHRSAAGQRSVAAAADANAKLQKFQQDSMVAATDAAMAEYDRKAEEIRAADEKAVTNTAK